MESKNKYETFPGWKDNTNDVWERTPDGGEELTNGEVRDRLNALEAERDQMLQKTQQLEAERDRLYELLGKCVVTNKQVHTDETIIAWDELQVMYDKHQSPERRR